jgi:putative ABC transport system permease protein
MIAFRNLSRNKIRSSLTLLGIAIGVSVFVSSVAIIHGFEDQTRDIIRSYDIDITVQAKGAATPVMSRISMVDYRQMSRIPGIRDISSLILGSIKTQWNPYFVIVGLSSIEMLARKFDMKEGRLFIPEKREVILGQGACNILKRKLGDELTVMENETFTIVGIFSTGHLLIDGAAVLDLRDAQRILKRDDHVNMAFIGVRKDRSPQEVLERIQNGFPGLAAKPASDFVSQIRLFKTIESVAWVISVISLVTCCVIVMNTFFMVVSERVKEIGILMAVGWSRLKILGVLLREAGLLCLMGSILGNGLAIFYLRLFNAMGSMGYGWVPQSIPLDVALASTAVSVAAGLLGSLYPAFAASRLSPAEALQSE